MWLGLQADDVATAVELMRCATESLASAHAALTASAVEPLAALATELQRASPRNTSAGRVAAPPNGFSEWAALRALSLAHASGTHARICACAAQVL